MDSRHYNRSLNEIINQINTVSSKNLTFLKNVLLGKAKLTTPAELQEMTDLQNTVVKLVEALHEEIRTIGQEIKEKSTDGSVDPNELCKKITEKIQENNIDYDAILAKLDEIDVVLERSDSNNGEIRNDIALLYTAILPKTREYAFEVVFAETSIYERLFHNIIALPKLYPLLEKNYMLPYHYLPTLALFAEQSMQIDQDDQLKGSKKFFQLLEMLEKAFSEQLVKKYFGLTFLRANEPIAIETLINKLNLNHEKHHYTRLLGYILNTAYEDVKSHGLQIKMKHPKTALINIHENQKELYDKLNKSSENLQTTFTHNKK